MQVRSITPAILALSAILVLGLGPGLVSPALAEGDCVRLADGQCSDGYPVPAPGGTTPPRADEIPNEGRGPDPVGLPPAEPTPPSTPAPGPDSAALGQGGHSRFA